MNRRCFSIIVLGPNVAGAVASAKGFSTKTAPPRPRSTLLKPARWVDCSGPITNEQMAGITLMDHPVNPNHPAPFDVRDNGWMGVCLTLDAPVTITPDKPVRLRYGLWIHPAVPAARKLDHQHEHPRGKRRGAQLEIDRAGRVADECLCRKPFGIPQLPCHLSRVRPNRPASCAGQISVEREPSLRGGYVCPVGHYISRGFV